MFGVVKRCAFHNFVEKPFDLCNSCCDSLLVVLVQFPVDLKEGQEVAWVVDS